MATHGDGADKIADRIILLKKGEFEHIISYKWKIIKIAPLIIYPNNPPPKN